MATDEPRPVRYLRWLTQEYPRALPYVDMARAKRRELGDRWPEHVHCPLALTQQLVPPYTQQDATRGGDGARIAVLAAWRATQGIYRFDPELQDELFLKPVRDVLPRELLYTLPESCVYVHTDRPLATNGGKGWVHGFFACLDRDPTHGQECTGSA